MYFTGLAVHTVLPALLFSKEDRCAFTFIQEVTLTIICVHYNLTVCAALICFIVKVLMNAALENLLGEKSSDKLTPQQPKAE